MIDPEDEMAMDASRAPLFEHLVELRKRLLISLATLAVLFGICLYFAEPIFGFLVKPLVAAGQKKVYYAQLFEAFFVQLKVAFFAATVLSFPVVANQLWQFIAPGLYRKEKRALLPFLLATPVLFAAGCAMAYYVAIPAALHFLLSYQTDVGGVQQEALPMVGNYLTVIMQFLFGFGVSFLLPVLLMLLERAGIVTLQQLVKAQRYAILGCFAVALFLAPPDAGSMVMLAAPLVGLFYLTLVAIWLTHRRRAKTDHVEAAG
ncbi:MAG: twin-arginine translocase subunit TatC [Sphingomonas sp.]|uniref:twin-arginine translocase subunit TatC n=1 Tax=Sphingomonas sp. TaxID=28214 RepID=UPI001ACD50E3|nr:twin-arginine translocase subunit TatC [Sphingomonas sp.]MBN8808363.1 twin-arginine translocase subunit TatC [Sphingomonas sp.]